MYTVLVMQYESYTQLEVTRRNENEMRKMDGGKDVNECDVEGHRMRTRGVAMIDIWRVMMMMMYRSDEMWN